MKELCERRLAIEEGKKMMYGLLPTTAGKVWAAFKRKSVQHYANVGSRHRALITKVTRWRGKATRKDYNMYIPRIALLAQQL
jgi:hypothetical protein